MPHFGNRIDAVEDGPQPSCGIVPFLQLAHTVPP
jgi:hypothetical protein